MKPPEDNAGPVESPAGDEDKLTSLPALQTWRHVYLFVFGCFVLWIVLLIALTMSYS